MKRVVKSSFGWSDDAWLNPPDNYYNGSSSEVSFKVENLKLISTPDKDILEPALSLGAAYDYETGIEILDEQEVEEVFWDAIADDIPENTAGTYLINGVLTIPYTAYYPEKGNMNRRSWEELVEENFERDIDFYNARFDGSIEKIA